MGKYNYHQSSFKNGMISEKLHGRTDIDEHANSAKDIKNFLPAPMGGLFSRPGSVTQTFIGTKGIVIPWERADGIYYIVYKQKALTSTECPFSAYDSYWVPKTCIYSLDQLESYGNTTNLPTHEALISAQSNSNNEFETLDYYGFSTVVIGNALVIAHISGKVPPLVLYVIAGGGVRIHHFQFSNQLSVSSASGSYYNSYDIHLGYKSYPYYINKDYTAWLLPGVAVPGGQEGKQTSSHVTTTLSAFLGNTATTLAYFTSDMVHTYFIVNQGNKEGVYFITSLASSSVANVIVIYYGLDNTTKTSQHKRQLFAYDLGFPKVMSTYNGRTILANTATKPNWFFCSRTNDCKELWGTELFQNLSSYPLTDISSFELSLTSRDYSEIKWISQQNGLLLGTGKEEFVISSTEKALSIKDIGVAPQSALGGSSVIAIKNSESVFFVSADGKSIRQTQYNYQVNGFRSKNISILNDDIIYKLRSNQTVSSVAEIRIVKLIWQESNRTLWALTNTNNLFSVTIEPNSETVAWAYHIIGNEDPVTDIFGLFSQGLQRSVLGLVVSRTDGYFVDFIAPEYLNTSLSVDSTNIGDQPVFMDGCALISTISPSVSFDCSLNLTAINFAALDDSWFGISQRFPTGKKVKITAVDVIDAGVIEVNLFVYIINKYTGYGLPEFQIATSLANALAGTAYSSGAIRNVTLEDAEPTAKYTKWGTFTKFTGETVDVIADGILYEDLVVDANGILTLPVAVSKVALGYRFTGHIKTLTPDMKGPFGSAIGSIKRADRAFIRYYNTRTAKIGTSESNLESVVFPSVPYTGAIDHFIDTPTDREWSLMIKKEQSLPLNVMSVTLRGKADE